MREITALEEPIAAANPTHPATIVATQFLSDTLATLTVEGAIPCARPNDDCAPEWFDNLRQQVVTHLLALRAPTITSWPISLQSGWNHIALPLSPVGAWFT